MIEQLRAAYSNYRGIRFAACTGILVCWVLLYCLAGGFPPWAWRFLLHVFPQIPRLWKLQGSAVLLPLVGLGLLSTALLIMWGALLIVTLQVVLHWWRGFHDRQHFARDLQEAERLAEQMAESEREQRTRRERQWAMEWQPQPVAVAASAVPPRQAYAIAPTARAVNAPMPAVNLANRPASSPLPSQRVERSVIPSPAASAPPIPLRERLRIVPPPSDEPDDEYPTPIREGDEQEIDQYDTLTNLDDGERIEAFDTLPQVQAVQTTEAAQEEQPLRLVVGIGLDTGIARMGAPNEDNLFAIQGMRLGHTGPEPVGLFVVADGMGGHADGQEASRLAIQAISDAVVPSLLNKADRDESFMQLLKEGAHRANLAVYQRNRQRQHMMGTTLTAALVVGATAYVVNVGDSRTYRYRSSDGLVQITHDHSAVARMVESGLISREEVYTHPQRNQIYRCLGEKSTLEVDQFKEELQAGDVLLLCSDGLWEMVRDSDIEKIIAASVPHPSQISTILIQAALTRGGADNVSVVVVCVQDPDG